MHQTQAAAQQVQSHGRGEDTVLVHMTPGEVQGLQALAMAHGGSLTINPHTGLPEASILKKLLPTLAGIGLNFIPGVGPLLAAGLVAAGSTAASGSLKKGLLAGLQAYGGASLAGAVMPAATGTVASSTAGAIGAGAPSGIPGDIAATNGTLTTSAAAPLGPGLNMAQAGQRLMEVTGGLPGNLAGAPIQAAGQAAQATAPAAKGLAGIYGRFGDAARLVGDAGGQSVFGLSSQLPAAVPRMLTTGLAGSGLISALNRRPSSEAPKKEVSNYKGPYIQAPRQVSYREPGTPTGTPGSSREHLYFSPTNVGVVPMNEAQQRAFGYLPQLPGPGDTPPEQGTTDFASGGSTNLENGSFVLDARTVSEIGNGSSSAGQEALKRLGGRPVKGGGDGVSDSIHANIGGQPRARLARDEVQFPPEAVRRIGGGSAQKGAKRLYSLMDKAEQARKSASRGQNTGLSSLMGAQRG